MLEKAIESFFTFELTEKFIVASARCFGVSKEKAKKLAFDSAIAAASCVATLTTLHSHDWWGAGISAAFIIAFVRERQLKERKRE